MAGTTSGVCFSKRGCDVDMILYQGATVNFEVIYGGTTPIDVTGYSAVLQARPTPDYPDALVEFKNPENISVGGVNGKFTLAMTAEETAVLPVFDGVYQFKITDPSGYVTPILSGNFSIIPEVAK